MNFFGMKKSKITDKSLAILKPGQPKPPFNDSQTVYLRCSLTSAATPSGLSVNVPPFALAVRDDEAAVEFFSNHLRQLLKNAREAKTLQQAAKKTLSTADIMELAKSKRPRPQGSGGANARQHRENVYYCNPNDIFFDLDDIIYYTYLWAMSNDNESNVWDGADHTIGLPEGQQQDWVSPDNPSIEEEHHVEHGEQQDEFLLTPMNHDTQPESQETYEAPQEAAIPDTSYDPPPSSSYESNNDSGNYESSSSDSGGCDSGGCDSGGDSGGNFD